MQEPYDFLIIGSGAGGAMSAHRLVESGARVLLLEKGSELPDDGSTLDPTLVAGGHFNSKEVWNNARGDSFMPEEHFNLGGKTRWYGAALLRNDPREFAADAALGLRAWPFDYAEFEPHYREAERLVGVRQFENEPDLRRIAVDLNASGWQTHPLQLGLSPQIAEHLSAATHYDGYAIPNGLKSDAKYRLLDPLQKHENLTLVLNATVRDLLPAEGDPLNIIGVRCNDGREYFAKTILLAAGAMHSPRLLQRYFLSTGLSDRLPAARNVGRNFKRHILTAVIGFGWRIKQDRLCKTSLFLHRDFPHSSSQPLGGWADRESIRFLLPKMSFGLMPKWLIEFFALRAYGFFLQTEDGSHADNRVIGESGDGSRPTLDYHAERNPELAREHRSMVWSFMLAMLRAGLLPFKQTIGLSGMAHCGGTLVTGNDPQNSVVDGYGRIHGMQNVYVVDGSVLPRLGRMNPALSIYAWSLRVTQALLATG